MCQCSDPPFDSSMIRRSVHKVGRDEALSFKWIESEKAGYDLGEFAIRLWVRRHWNGFLRARWIQHLEGKVYWIELDHDDFGLLDRAFPDSRLFPQIIARIKAGGENLEILNWVREAGESTDEAIEILEALDINSRRIESQLEDMLSQSH